jgi:hypothetical protein
VRVNAQAKRAVDGLTGGESTLSAKPGIRAGHPQRVSSIVPRDGLARFVRAFLFPRRRLSACVSRPAATAVDCRDVGGTNSLE